MTSLAEETRHLDERPTTPVSNASAAFDLICIGFGPAQIATAIAHRESNQPSNVLFLERNPAFQWHSPSVPRSRMENPFVYDLATTRNPKSQFTYVNYLLAKQRLIEFANSDRLNPLRIEFEEYLRWCADHFEKQVRYQHEVISIIPEREAEVVNGWNVAVKDVSGNSYIVTAKNILVPTPSATGQRKQNPLNNVNFEAGQRIISFEDYLSRRDQLREPRDPRLDLTVVGSSHRALEILDDLLSCHRLGNITAVTDNESLEPVRILSDRASPPEPRLCSIWAKPSCNSNDTLASSSELIQRIYSRGYEKQVQTKGKFALRVVLGKSSAALLPESNFIITDDPGQGNASSNGLFHGLDSLVLGCRQKGESLEEVQFKRGAVAEGCRMWMMSANSEGGRSLAKDIAVRAGEVVKALSAAAGQGRDGLAVISAKM